VEAWDCQGPNNDFLRHACAAHEQYMLEQISLPTFRKVSAIFAAHLKHDCRGLQRYGHTSK
jgi:hypothetical protein